MKNILHSIKNFQKYFMTYQYMPKIFHDTSKNPQSPPFPTYLIYDPYTKADLH